MTPSEAVRAAQSALNNLGEHLDVIDSFAERRAGADTALAATQKEHEKVKADLKFTQSQLDAVEHSLRNKAAILDDERARALKEINDRIKDAGEELAGLEVQLKAKREAHDQVVASMGSLVSRLDLKRAG